MYSHASLKLITKQGRYDDAGQQRRLGQGIEIRTPTRPPGLHGQLEYPDEVPFFPISMLSRADSSWDNIDLQSEQGS